MAAPETNVGEDVVESGASEYERAGRQTNRTMASRTVDGVTTPLTWDVTSSLTDSNGQGGHVVCAYDASGQRVVQDRVADAEGVGTASAYVASGQVDDPNTVSTSTGDVTATRYYTFAGSTVAVRTDDGKLSLMLGDEQGSTNVVMPVTTTTGGAMEPATLTDASLITRTSYTPYGELRGADNTAVDRGWLGQVEDRIVGTGASSTGTGLTYLNARYYDPVLSRFLSPDPLMDPGDPRTLDPYVYSSNNPVSYTDASGLRQDVSGTVSGNDKYYSSPKNKNVSTATGTPRWTLPKGKGGTAPRLSTAPPPSPPLCGTGFACGSEKDKFYSTWWGAGLGGLENYTRGFADAIIGVADLAVTIGCTWGHGTLLTSAGRSCWTPNSDGGFSLSRIGPSGFKDANISYYIGAIDNPLLLIGGGGGTAANTTSTTSRVFWSGGNSAKDAAATFAVANGGKTLEMTATGKSLEWLTQRTSYEFTKPLWDKASMSFANGAKGQADVFFGPGGPSPMSIYSNIENPILQQNGVVITTHWAWVP